MDKIAVREQRKPSESEGAVIKMNIKTEVEYHRCNEH